MIMQLRTLQNLGIKETTYFNRKRCNKMNIKTLVAHWNDIHPETKIQINYMLSVGCYVHKTSYSMNCLEILVSKHEICNMDLTKNNIEYYFGINSTGAYIEIIVME